MMNLQVSEAGIEILRVLCGSRAYGLHDDGSDFDYHGIFVVPTATLLSIGPKIRETAWIEGTEQDNTAWEVGHFLRLAVHCNPTVLETFVAPVETQSEWGGRVRALFPYVISRKRVYEAFRGYSHNQRKKMFEPTGGVRAGERMWKFAVSYIRVLYHGIRLLQTGAYDPLIPESEMRDFLMAVKLGEVAKGVIVDRAEGLQSDLTDAYLESSIAEEPSMDAVNEVLLTLRRDMWAR